MSSLLIALMHVFLDPYVPGATELRAGVEDTSSHDGQFASAMTIEADDGESIEFISKYAWIPSTFRVSDDGKDARIESYINGLGSRENFPLLYRLIELVFVLALPHLEKTLAYQYEHKPSDSGTHLSQFSSVAVPSSIIFQSTGGTRGHI